METIQESQETEISGETEPFVRIDDGKSFGTISTGIPGNIAEEIEKISKKYKTLTEDFHTESENVDETPPCYENAKLRTEVATLRDEAEQTKRKLSRAEQKYVALDNNVKILTSELLEKESEERDCKRESILGYRRYHIGKILSSISNCQ